MLSIVVQASNINEIVKNRNMQLINGEPMILFLLNRFLSEKDMHIVFSTSNHKRDDELAELVKRLDIPVVRGEYSDVLGRLIKCAETIEDDNFVRVYGNYPLVDFGELRKLYGEHIEGNFDYSYNEHREGVLWGTGCDVFNKAVLCRLDSELHSSNQRESISFYLQQNASKYKINRSAICKTRPSYKLYVETKKDFEVIVDVYNNISSISNQEIIRYLGKHEVLAKYNLENPAKEVGIEKLFLHSDKVQDILQNGVHANTYPISVELTLTNACNLDCVYCSDRELRRRQGCKNMSVETFEALFRDLAAGGTKGVVFEGGGEPTIYPYFNSLVKSAKGFGLAVGLITNGTQELESDILEQLEWIRVSLDASNEEEYFELKKVNCFEKVLENIGKYAAHCRTVGVGYVVTNKNMLNIETLILRLRGMGVSYIQLRPVVDNPNLLPDEKDLRYLEFYRGGGFNVIVDGMFENLEKGNSSLPCYASSITNVISGDGNVYLCGRLNIYDWIKPIGNICEKNFSEIWMGEERKKQLDMIADRTFCANNCPQCRVSKYNSLFERLASTKSVHFI